MAHAHTPRTLDRTHMHAHHACMIARVHAHAHAHARTRTHRKASKQVGPHNIYDIYDNCPRTSEYLREQGNKTMRWLLSKVRSRFNSDTVINAAPGSGPPSDTQLGGGYEWGCGDTYPPGAISPWYQRADVQKALHLDAPGRSGFKYHTSGPASVLLYPKLIQKIRIMIYNGGTCSYASIVVKRARTQAFLLKQAKGACAYGDV